MDNMEKLGPLGQALECSVCLEVLNESSRVLPCQHTFCESCLIDISNSHKELRCPECRVLVTVPLRELPPNILLMRVLESIKNLPQQNQFDVAKSVSTMGAKQFISEKALSTNSETIIETSLQINSLNQQPVGSFASQLPRSLNASPLLISTFGEASSLPQMMHNLTSDSPPRTTSNPFVSNEPISDGSSKEHSDQIDFFPTDFSSRIMECSGSVNSAATSLQVLPEPKNLNTISTITAKKSSLNFNSFFDDQFSSTTSIGHSEAACLDSTNVALTGLNVPSFMQNLDHNRRKSINLPTSTVKPNNLSSSNPKEGRKSLSGNFTRKNNDFMNISATALYPYSQKEFWDLSFKKGDVITIMQKVDDNWYQGKLNGQVGFIPSSYVKVQPVVSYCPSNFPQCLALFDFKIAAENMKGLSFRKGDVITVLRRVDANWAEGKLDSKIGIFPLSFVEMNEAAKSLLDSSSKNLSEKPLPEENSEVKTISTLNTGITENLIDIETKSSIQNTSAEIQNNVYECIHPYVPSKGDELLLNKGSFYCVSEKCKDGWFKGRCLVTDKVGVFPGNYVSSSSGAKLETNFTLQERENSKNILIKEKKGGNLFLVNQFSNCALSPNHSKSAVRYSPSLNASPGGSMNIIRKTEINKFKNGKHNLGKNERREKVKDSKIFRQPAPLMRERYRCIVPYPPCNSDEMELQQGDIIYVHRKMDDGWFKGTLQRTGESGLFPSSFIEPY